MNPLVASVIRTLVPVAVGQVSSWLLLVNVDLTPDARTGLGAFLGGLLTAIYYVGVRIIEQQWPGVGVLLGLPKSPDTYSKDTQPAAVATPAVAPAVPEAPAAVSFAPTQAKLDALPATDPLAAAQATIDSLPA